MNTNDSAKAFDALMQETPLSLRKGYVFGYQSILPTKR